MSKYIPKTKNTAAPGGRKSVKMEADELTEKIKACVKVRARKATPLLRRPPATSPL